MHDRGEIAAVVEEEVRGFAIGERAKLLVDAPIVLFFGLPLPGVNGNARRGDSGGGVVLRREDVAARPSDLGAQLDEGLDEDGRLDGHVKATRDARASKRLLGAVLTAKRHQTRHFVLGDRDLLSAPVGQ